MRVAWVIYGKLEQPTGGYVYDRMVVEGLRRLGLVVDVFGLTPGELDHRALRVAIDRGGYTWVVGDELCHPELEVLFRGLRERPLPDRPKLMLLVHHLTVSETSVFVASEQTVLGLADAIVTTSTTTQRQVQEWASAPVSVCQPGADRLACLPREGERGRSAPRLLFVGTWTARKGLLRLIDYLAQLPELEFELTVVGDPARDTGYTQRVSARLAGVPWLAARARVLGVVDDCELAAVYAASDLLILPSSYEGYGMVLTEALFAGVPVLASNVGATSEVVSHGRDGWLLPVGDDAAWVHGLRQLVSEPERLASWSRAPRTLPAWAQTVTDWQRVLDGRGVTRCEHRR